MSYIYIPPTCGGHNNYVDDSTIDLAERVSHNARSLHLSNYSLCDNKLSIITNEKIDDFYEFKKDDFGTGNVVVLCKTLNIDTSMYKSGSALFVVFNNEEGEYLSSYVHKKKSNTSTTLGGTIGDVIIPSVNNGVYFAFTCSVYPNTRIIQDGTNIVHEESIGQTGVKISLSKSYNIPKVTDVLRNLYITIKIGDFQYLAKTNGVEYTPTEDYHPATKKYVDDSIANTQSSTGVKEYDIFLTEDNQYIGKVGYINVDEMEVNIRYGLLSHNDCNMIAFVIQADDNNYKLISLIATYTAFNYIVTEKWDDDTGKGIVLRSDIKDFVINITDKSTADTITIEEYDTRNYLALNGTKEYTPTKEYHPATKKYVDDSKKVTIISKTDNISLCNPAQEVSVLAVVNAIYGMFENTEGLFDYNQIYSPSITVAFTDANGVAQEKSFIYGIKSDDTTIGRMAQVFSEDDEYYMSIYFSNLCNIDNYEQQIFFELQSWEGEVCTINNIEWKDIIDLRMFATKKYVDDSLTEKMSFDADGNLVITINGVTKKFVPKE